MSMISPSAQYQQQAVNTATPGELIVLLFGAAVKNIKMAMKSIRDKQLAEAHNRIIKTENIFNALIESLDMKIPMSQDLMDLYDFINSQLVQANLKKDCGILEELLPIVVDLRNTWQEAEKIYRIDGRKLG